MSTYPLEKLLGMWKQADLSVEQLAGHLLQHLMAQEKRILALEKGQPNRPQRPLNLLSKSPLRDEPNTNQS